jgi:hypothetical protein
MESGRAKTIFDAPISHRLPRKARKFAPFSPIRGDVERVYM